MGRPALRVRFVQVPQKSCEIRYLGLRIANQIAGSTALVSRKSLFE